MERVAFVYLAVIVFAVLFPGGEQKTTATPLPGEATLRTMPAASGVYEGPPVSDAVANARAQRAEDNTVSVDCHFSF